MQPRENALHSYLFSTSTDTRKNPIRIASGDGFLPDAYRFWTGSAASASPCSERLLVFFMGKGFIFIGRMLL